jgi:hypothetical protein
MDDLDFYGKLLPGAMGVIALFWVVVVTAAWRVARRGEGK